LHCARPLFVQSCPTPVPGRLHGLELRCAMPNASTRRSLTRRILLVVAGLLAFTLVWVVAVRLAVENIYRGIETQRASGLSAIAGPFSNYSADSDSTTWGSTWISKSASLHMHAIHFDQSVGALDRIVAGHHSYLEDLRTESRPGCGPFRPISPCPRRTSMQPSPI